MVTQSSQCLVELSAGKCRGQLEDGVAVFRGIPFARPPVGELRFAAPRPAEPWEGVRDALAFGPPVPQSQLLPDPPPPQPVAEGEWLTLNVWAPRLDADALQPVMVWIYGGAYMAGTSGRPEYDGSRLARIGELVVVTLNYRTGMEGFALIEGAPANRGLLDQLAALQWVQDNVQVFGGDPEQVTVFGNSAGAGSIAALLAMPRAEDLFRRAVAQSPSSPFFSPELAADIAAEISREIGLRATVEELASVKPARLVAAADAVARRLREFPCWGNAYYGVTPFYPVIDGDVLPALPWDAVAAGSGREVELIAGHTRNEYAPFLIGDGDEGEVTGHQLDAALRALSPGPNGARRYREAFPNAGARQLLEVVLSDWLFRMCSLRLAEAHARAGGRTFLYELTWAPPALGGELGAPHGLDTSLVFGTLTEGAGRRCIGEEPTQEALELSAEMQRAWVAFAGSGDPGWPAFDNHARLTKIFDVPSSVIAYPEEESRRIWQDHRFSISTLTGAE